jgi:hypothetical protein
MYRGMRLAIALALTGCSTQTPVQMDAGPDTVEADASAGPPACVKSKDPAPFPPDSCGSPMPASPDALDEALGLVQLDRCSLQLKWASSCTVMYPKDAHRMSDFTALLTFPLRLPHYGAEMAGWLDDAMKGSTPVAAALAAAAQRRGVPLTDDDCADSSWWIVGSNASPLASALVEVDANLDLGATTDALSGVPLDLQRALVPIIRAIGHGAQDVSDARGPASTNLNKLKFTPSLVLRGWPYDVNSTPYDAFYDIDVAAMTRAAVRIATAIEGAKLAQFAGKDVPETEIDTAFGAIVIHGPGADTCMPGSKSDGAAFLLDTGGDDTYRVPVGAGTFDRAVSVAIDLGGKDLYAYVEKADPADTGHRLPSDGKGRSFQATTSRIARQGAGVLGVGLQFDFGNENDTYRSLAVSQGLGVLGVGVSWNQGGDDSYTTEGLSQGAAAWGIGLLLDGAGNDSYTTYTEGQGFGFTQGFGAIVDASGDDTYWSDPGEPTLGGDPIYPSAQLPGPPNSAIAGNFTMTQGGGMGLRSDSPFAGHQFPGGMGVLRDAAGNDKYSTGVFGQASAFAMGMGFLLDGAGDDKYEGLWYVQASAAHTGISYFDDAAGADQYNPKYPIQATSIGVGHDCSASVHYDEGGDDRYRGGDLSIGGGNAAGVGIFVNAGGADTFVLPTSYSLGGTGFDYNPGIPVIGVFVKANGSATYTTPNAAVGPNKSWSYKTTADNTNIAKSTGVDRPSGNVTLP